ncbi:MAG: hypothetical protein WD030_02395, partial [Pirellulales bacterium]
TLMITRATSGDSGGDFSLSTIHGFRSRQFDIANGTSFAPRLLVVLEVPETSTFATASAGFALLALLGLFRCRSKRE